jgi:hypothetical protein
MKESHGTKTTKEERQLYHDLQMAMMRGDGPPTVFQRVCIGAFLFSLFFLRFGAFCSTDDFGRSTIVCSDFLIGSGVE